MSAESGIGKWKHFLESTPPNSPTKIPELIRMRAESKDSPMVPSIICPPIKLHCQRDGGSRRFEPAENVFFKQSSFKHSQDFRFLTYRCRDCRQTERIFAVKFRWDRLLTPYVSQEVEVMKLGEYPPFATAISPRVQKLLKGPDLELYRKGLRSIDHGLGIGAASYLRRIVESQWELVVTEIRKAAKRLGIRDLSAFDAALKSHQFSSAVKSLKDIIPEKLLLPGGHNPLTVLHQLLSRQLHGQSDDECLQQAQAIQLVLTRLLENIATVLKDEAELSAALRMLQTSTDSGDQK